MSTKHPSSAVSRVSIENAKAIDGILAEITAFQREILSSVYGLGGRRPRLPASIALSVETTPTEVLQITSGILRRLRGIHRPEFRHVLARERECIGAILTAGTGIVEGAAVFSRSNDLPGEIRMAMDVASHGVGGWLNANATRNGRSWVIDENPPSPKPVACIPSPKPVSRDPRPKPVAGITSMLVPRSGDPIRKPSDVDETSEWTTIHSAVAEGRLEDVDFAMLARAIGMFSTACFRIGNERYVPTLRDYVLDWKKVEIALYKVEGVGRKKVCRLMEEAGSVVGMELIHLDVAKPS
jgi:hypothetical protein